MIRAEANVMKTILTIFALLAIGVACSWCYHKGIEEGLSQGTWAEETEILMAKNAVEIERAKVAQEAAEVLTVREVYIDHSQELIDGLRQQVKDLEAEVETLKKALRAAQSELSFRNSSPLAEQEFRLQCTL